MTIGLDFLIFGIALAILIKGSDFFVDAAAHLAKTFGVSDFIIGLTIVAIGTSLPELFSSIFAALNNNTGLVIGNIVGSNIANIGLVLGLSSVIAVLEIKKEVFRRDGLFLILISLLFLVFSLNKTISKFEGLILLSLFIIYMAYLFRFQPGRRIFKFRKFLKNVNVNFIKSCLSFKKYKECIYLISKVFISQRRLNNEEEKFFNILKDVIFLIVGGGAIYLGAKYVIPSAVNIALFFNVPEDLVGLILISIGTSLPELLVSFIALKKGLNNILIGNILGSNIANLLLIGGSSALINPLILNTISLIYIIPFMVIMTFLLLSFIRSHWILKMFEGLILMVLYILFIISLVLFFV